MATEKQLFRIDTYRQSAYCESAEIAIMGDLYRNDGTQELNHVCVIVKKGTKVRVPAPHTIGTKDDTTVEVDAVEVFTSEKLCGLSYGIEGFFHLHYVISDWHQIQYVEYEDNLIIWGNLKLQLSFMEHILGYAALSDLLKQPDVQQLIRAKLTAQ